MRHASLLALLLPVSAGAGHVEIETLGQAQLVARRHALDEAVEELRVQAETLRVTDEQSLAEWSQGRPEAALAVDQALRDAAVVVDKPAEGRWHVTLQADVGTLSDGLRPWLRQGLREEGAQRLRAHGSAAIPWEGGDVNVVVPLSPPEAIRADTTDQNLPPLRGQSETDEEPG